MASKKPKTHKYIFVVGGVMSGVGKGIATASIGRILQARGLRVNPIKVDPYLNVDAGTMNPTEHGEVFVLNSGLETDQDMGNYERMLEMDLSNDDYLTTGMVYKHLIDKERSLGFRGKCLEAIPYVTNEIVRRIQRAAETHASDVSLVEIGGTVGDYENMLYIEAARILKIKHPRDVIFILVSYLPIPSKIGEMKTRPTQHAVRMLNSFGVQPDFIIARSELPLDTKRKEKLAFTCNVQEKHVISAPDIESIYDVPINFERDNMSDILLEALEYKARKPKNGLSGWRKFVHKVKNPTKEVRIGIVGKYFSSGDFVLSDAYISVIEAIKFSAYKLGAKPVLEWLNANDYESAKAVQSLAQYDGVLVPGGFGETGIEGKINAIQFCRESKIPYFGLCYGMQLMTIEYARNVVGMKGANTTEINPNTKYPVIDILPDQRAKLEAGNYGGSMRLGSYECELVPGTIAADAYDAKSVMERHRHRYEVNPEYIEQLAQAGLVFSGRSPNGTLMEIAELSREQHPFFLGVQFHPEFLARPLTPHPLFTAFIKAALKRQKK
jgi:CTP synthase